MDNRNQEEDEEDDLVTVASRFVERVNKRDSSVR